MGNGFTIDLLNFLKKDDVINVKNLFKNGDKVPWLGDDEPGFLSYKRCPNLWNLGVRPNSMDDGKAIKIIEDIITCANIYAYSKKNSGEVNSENIYIRAYKELSSYLRYLFIYYNDLVSDNELCSNLKEWGWYKYFNKIKNQLKSYEKIDIITYNYDIFLERLLINLDIKFNITGFERNDAIINVIKPHGSISFIGKKLIDNSSFKINYKRDLMDGEIKDMKINYDEIKVNSPINAIIPPAGDSNRFALAWAKQLKDFAIEAAKEIISGDDVLICGISYWHVDRMELDEIFLSLNPDVNIKQINPFPSDTLNAVISSVFENFLVYSNSDILGRL